MEIKLNSDFRGLSATLIDNYGELTPEAHMSANALLVEGYDYGQLIHRREVPVVKCDVKHEDGVMKVYCRTTRGYEYIGYTREMFTLPARTSLIIKGGQFIKVVRESEKNKKVQVTLPYEYWLSVRPL